jgi:hypothetical protein
MQGRIYWMQVRDYWKDITDYMVEVTNFNGWVHVPGVSFAAIPPASPPAVHQHASVAPSSVPHLLYYTPHRSTAQLLGVFIIRNGCHDLERHGERNYGRLVAGV